MTKDEFIFYVKGVIASEMERGRLDNAEVDFIGPLKLIKDALDKVDLSQPNIFPFGTPNLYVNNEPDEVPYGSICACNPKNGGSGICGCIMGNQMVSNPKKYGCSITNFGTTTNSLNINDIKATI
jgi:hypothetical protein